MRTDSFSTLYSLYEDGIDLLARSDCDLQLAVAALLGRGAARDLATATITQVLDVCAPQKKLDTFAAKMIRATPGDPERAWLLIDAFLQALRE